MDIPDVAIGPIVASTIGALAVYLSTVFAKEQKTSEFRQLWIDELRKDIADFLATVSEYCSLGNHIKDKSEEFKCDFLVGNIDALKNIQSLEHRIVLRLNPKEHEELISEIRSYTASLISIYFSASGDKTVQGESIANALIAKVQVIFSDEWKRVKTGEPIFKWTKRISLLTFVVLLGYSAYAVVS